MDTRPPGERCHYAVCIAPIFELSVAQGLAVQHIPTLQGDLAVPVRAHLIWKLGHGEKCVKHAIDVGVALGRHLKVGAALVSCHQTFNLLVRNLSSELAVALVPADDQRNVCVLFRFGLEA